MGGGVPARAAGPKAVGAPWIALCMLVTAPAWSEQEAGVQRATPPPAAPEREDERFNLDLPAQPLASALVRYGALTLKSTLYRSSLVEGRTSAPVHGRYTAQTALNLLLAGTGLVAERIENDPTGTFVLKPGRSEIATALPDAAAALAGYPALVQMHVLTALCGDPRAQPGDYRLLLSFRVNDVGQVQHPVLLATTGDVRRDAAVLEALRRIRMEYPPPPELPQPFSILILPRTANPICGGAS